MLQLYADNQPSLFLSVLNVVRSAQRAHEAASFYGPESNTSLPVGNTPRDPSLDPTRGQYGYRVVIQVDDGSGRELPTTAITVYFDQPATFAQISQAAMAAYHAGQFERDSGRKFDDAGFNPAIEVFVISAGRSS